MSQYLNSCPLIPATPPTSTPTAGPPPPRRPAAPSASAASAGDRRLLGHLPHRQLLGRWLPG
jgi:hypothetical protein